MNSPLIFRIVIPLFILLAVLAGCKKNKNEGPDYTGKIGGIRHWHGTYSYQEDRPITDSTYYYTDFHLTSVYVIQHHCGDHY